MSEFRGTKGNWDVIITSGISEFETDVKCGQIRIAEVKHYNHGKKDWTVNDPIPSEGKANALLISKAPEMLEMLERASNLIDSLNCSALVDEIEQLIKEATTL